MRGDLGGVALEFPISQFAPSGRRGSNRWAAEASDLGFAVGRWPQEFSVRFDERPEAVRRFVLFSGDEDRGVYRTPDGPLTIIVFND